MNYIYICFLLVPDKAEVSLHPERPSNDDLPSKFFSMAFSDAEGDKGLGPPPVFGLLISDSFPFANENKNVQFKTKVQRIA